MWILLLIFVVTAAFMGFGLWGGAFLLAALTMILMAIVNK
jgi:hypothetical protein